MLSEPLIIQEVMNKINILPIQLLMLIAPFLVGLFYEFSCCFGIFNWMFMVLFSKK